MVTKLELVVTKDEMLAALATNGHNFESFSDVSLEPNFMDGQQLYRKKSTFVGKMFGHHLQS